MDTALFDRSLGDVSPAVLRRSETSRQISALAFAPEIRFEGLAKPNGSGNLLKRPELEETWAHKAGVQNLVIDHFDGRYALSGGSDASINLWDLEEPEISPQTHCHRPIGLVPRGDESHKFGITSLLFYPFDPGLFVSSSYDHHVNVYDTNSLEVSASFDLSSKVYSCHMSLIASNVLVATASQHSSIRLIDLRSASTLHSLVGHHGAVMSVAWSPRDEFVLASGGLDGTLRLWDIRRSASCLGVFDLEDSTGILGNDGTGSGARSRLDGKAHVGGCNGLSWTEDGEQIVSTGYDERIRVWSVALGANELSHFGPRIRNKTISTVLPVIVPRAQSLPGRRLMFYPNEKETLMFDMFEGTLLKRLRPPGASIAPGKKGAGSRNVASRVSSLAWRRDHLELYSSHSDGHIYAWTPQSTGDVEVPEDDEENEKDSEVKKRKALDDIFKSLTKKPITFN